MDGHGRLALLRHTPITGLASTPRNLFEASENEGTYEQTRATMSICGRTVAFTISLLVVSASAGFAQECLHGPDETTTQATRRTAALDATRNVNNIQFNRAGAREGVFLSHAELSGSPFMLQWRERNPDVDSRISLDPTKDILPDWKLTLDVTENGYWFKVQDTSDPCGFAYISNTAGVIYRSEYIR